MPFLITALRAGQWRLSSALLSDDLGLAGLELRRRGFDVGGWARRLSKDGEG